MLTFDRRHIGPFHLISAPPLLRAKEIRGGEGGGSRKNEEIWRGVGIIKDNVKREI